MANPQCPDNCQTELPVITVNDCNPVIVKSGINILFFAKKTALPLTDWTNPSEWASRISNSSPSDNAIRFVKGTGSLPAGTPQTITYQVNKTRTIGKSRTLTFTIEEANPTIHNLIRIMECGGEYRFWWQTIGERLYGGNEGVVSGYDANLVLNSGENDYEQRIIELSWDNKFSPEMIISPIAGIIGEAPDVFDTILTFESDVEDNAEGVTGTVGSSNPITRFEFNRISPITGTPASMTIEVNGSQVIVVDFPTDYLGRPFRYTHSNGSVHTGNFINGTVDFTSSSS